VAVEPIQIVPVRGVPVAPAAAPALTYRGGPLLSAVRIYLFYWGVPWAQAPLAAQASALDGFFDYVVTSPLLDQLAEYGTSGRPIGHGTHVGGSVLSDPPPASRVTDSDVQATLRQALQKNPALPQPGPDSLYYLFLPPGVSVTLGGSASCTSFCGYHSDTDFNGPTRLFYAVMPYPDCSGCAGGVSVVDALTATSSHELCEAITDPIAGQGWYDDQNGEIGDICAWQTKRLGAYLVQLEWSNRAGRCI